MFIDLLRAELKQPGFQALLILLAGIAASIWWFWFQPIGIAVALAYWFWKTR